jgi:hypothetical protein
MDRCDVFAEAVLDEKAVRPAGFDEHLVTCAKCRALVQAHRSALKLEGAVMPARWRVARSKVVVRLGVVAAVLVAGVFWVKRPPPLTSPGDGGAVVRALPPGEGTLTADPEVDFAALRMGDEGWGALAELHEYTANASRRDPAVELAYADRSLAASYLLTSNLEK